MKVHPIEKWTRLLMSIQLKIRDTITFEEIVANNLHVVGCWVFLIINGFFISFCSFPKGST